MLGSPLVRIAAAVALVCVVLLSACGKDLQDDPRDAVDQFLLNAAVDPDGVEACRYLTPAEQHAVSQAGGRLGCGQALDGVRIAFGQQLSTRT
jgi:hypothetical protein